MKSHWQVSGDPAKAVLETSLEKMKTPNQLTTFSLEVRQNLMRIAAFYSNYGSMETLDYLRKYSKLPPDRATTYVSGSQWLTGATILKIDRGDFEEMIAAQPACSQIWNRMRTHTLKGIDSTARKVGSESSKAQSN